MKTLSLLIAAACTLATTGASAAVVDRSAPAAASPVATCSYVGSYYTVEATYDVYECYSNGDGSY